MLYGLFLYVMIWYDMIWYDMKEYTDSPGFGKTLDY